MFLQDARKLAISPHPALIMLCKKMLCKKRNMAETTVRGILGFAQTHVDIVVCCQNVKLNFTPPVCFFSKHSMNTCSHHIFHVGDSNDRDGNVAVDIPVPSAPKKRRVTNEGTFLLQTVQILVLTTRFAVYCQHVKLNLTLPVYFFLARILVLTTYSM